MRFITLMLTILSLCFFVGCKGGEKAANGAGNDNSASDADNGQVPGSSGGGSQGGTPPVVEPPKPSGPQPGDKVAVSEKDPSASYPAVGAPVNYDINPAVEPNTDVVVPVVAITATPNPYIPETSGSVSLWAADNNDGSGLESIKCSVDGGAYVECGEKVDLTNLSEGHHTVKAVAKDYDGNESSEVSYTFYVDTQPPEVLITQAPQAATKETTTAFEFRGNDAGSGVAYYECRVDDQPLSRCSDEKAFSNLSEGGHAVYVRAVDNVGHKSNTLVHRWVVDNSAPTITFIEKPDQQTYTGNDAVINFQVEDRHSPNGIKTSCTLNSQAIACASKQSIQIPSSKPETFVFVVTSTDAVGNSTSSTVTWESVHISEKRTSSLTVEEIRPVDILFVIDNSGSMNDERSNLAQRINGMVNHLTGLDWQIAITSTDVDNNDAKSDGKLIELHGMAGQYILDSTMDVTNAQNVFGTTVQNFGGGSGHEQGIYASQRVIERYLAGDANHTNFLRQNSDLSIVVLSDEDENSNGSSVKTTPQGFVNFFNNTFNGSKKLTFHSIIGRPGDSSCKAPHAGNTYDKLSRLTGYGEVGGAIIGNVCAQDYASQLSDIGQSVKDLQNSIKLSCNPFDANSDGKPDFTVQFRKDAQSAWSTFTATNEVKGSSIVYKDLLPPGEYKVDYQCRIN